VPFNSSPERACVRQGERERDREREGEPENGKRDGRGGGVA